MGRITSGMGAAKPTRFIALSFVALILIGALLLMLPIATSSGRSAGFFTAIFTSASATCVTGLTVVDTQSYWSTFGHVVLLLLIQIGGLGLITAVTFASFALGRRIGLKERLIMVQTLNVSDIHGVVRLVRHIMFGTLIFEGLGAVVFSFSYVPIYGWMGGIWRAVFHAVSAFCNCGLDLDTTASSMSGFVSDYTFNIATMVLIVVGGLGFIVWEDLLAAFKARQARHLMVHTKLVLLLTATLLLFGAVSFALTNWRSEGYAPLSNGERVLASVFQSATLRSAGFHTVDLAKTSELSQLLSVLLMLIGAGSGSTACGIKLVTLAVVCAGVFATIRGREDVNLMGRRIDLERVRDCMAVFLSVVALDIVATAWLVTFDNLPIGSALIQAASGLGTGIAFLRVSALTIASQTMLIVLMYLGRVGLMTLGIASVMKAKTAKVRYPETQIMIG